MFKIEFLDKNNQPSAEVYNNSPTDDWIQGLPARYEVPKENFTIFKFDVDLPEAHMLYRSNKLHELDLYTSGIVKMYRKDLAPYVAGQILKLADYTNRVAERVSNFTDLTPVSVTAPATVQYNFGDGDEDAVQIPQGHAMTSEEKQLVVTYTGTQLTEWPYDENGKFLGVN